MKISAAIAYLEKKREERKGDGAIEEEVFPLLGRDVLAVSTIEHWCELAAKLGVPPARILEAYGCRDRMKETENRKVPD